MQMSREREKALCLLFPPVTLLLSLSLSLSLSHGGVLRAAELARFICPDEAHRLSSSLGFSLSLSLPLCRSPYLPLTLSLSVFRSAPHRFSPLLSFSLTFFRVGEKLGLVSYLCTRAYIYTYIYTHHATFAALFIRGWLASSSSSFAACRN